MDSILCDICKESGDTTTAESRCIECATFLCKYCERAHRRFTQTKSHQVYKLTGTSKKDRERARKESKLRDVNCDKHTDEELNLFCTDDQTVVCNVCARENHPGHNIVDIEEVADDEKTNLRLLQGLAIQRKALLDDNLEDSKVALQEYDRKTRALLDAINADYDAKRRELEQHFDMLRNNAKAKTDVEVDKKKAKQRVIEGDINITEDTKQAATDLIADGHPIEIMRASKGTTKKLNDWKELPEKDTVEMHTFTYEPGTLDLTNMGHVKRELRNLCEPKIEKRTNVGTAFTGGSIGHDNNIVVCTSTHIYTYDVDSFVKQHTSTADGTFYDVCRIQ
ncbi:unnamed protein product [Owenia fusiformis]|uniref:B box-type domain-containing protein n=1 Tax=Owenia fusiformis TaxID=6347 RepID=A0A8S4PHJ9_OWEFU|nr:unnamed protein product [Owenia fusiformis]